MYPTQQASHKINFNFLFFNKKKKNWTVNKIVNGNVILL